MAAGRIAVRYAKPILELAEEKKILDKVKEDMESFVALCKDSRDFALMLKSPIIPHLKKAEILTEIFSDKVTELTLLAFQTITRKKRENLLEDIASQFLKLYNQKKGIAKVQVTTSFKLDSGLRKSFEQLAKDVTGKTAVLTEVVDPEIMGGYVLKTEDQQIDESVAGQLNELKLKFSKNK